MLHYDPQGKEEHKGVARSDRALHLQPAPPRDEDTTDTVNLQQLATDPEHLNDEFRAIAWRYTDPPDKQWLEFADLLAKHYTPPETGRHSIIADEKTIARLLTFLAQGSWRETACHRAGTNPVTLNTLLKRGEDGEIPFNAFLWAVKRAEGVAEDELVAQVRGAGKDPRFWAAAMTALERKYQDRYGRNTEASRGPNIVVQIGVNDRDVQVNLATTELSPLPFASLAP